MFPADVMSLIYQIFKDFGFGFVGWAILCWLIYKLAYNHIAHIDAKIDVIGKDVKDLSLKIDTTNEKVQSLAERTAKLEGEVQ